MPHTLTICSLCKSLNKVESEKGLKGEALCGKCGTSLKFYGLVTEVSTEDFRRILAKSDLPVVVDFWASWCGPCKVYGPEFQKASIEQKGAVFLKVNTETEQALSNELGIRSIPCTIIFKSGKEVRRQSGVMNAGQIGSMIS